MKLLFENWRNYKKQILVESEMHPKIKTQWEKAIAMGLKFELTVYGTGFPGMTSLNISLLDGDGRRVGELEAKHDARDFGSGPGRGMCNRALVISRSGVKVSHGLGPLLYDLAFEVAEKKGLQGLGPDSREVSEEAAAV